MSLSKSETDIILNKANIALARSQRLVASWLPAQTSEDQAHTKTDEELQREEDEVFTAVPETLGLGAPLPTKAADGCWSRTEIDSNDKLRRQLLGRNYKKVMAEKARQKNAAPGSISLAPINSTSSKAKGTLPRREENGTGGGGGDDDNDDDEEEGRTVSVGKNPSSRKRKLDGRTKPTWLENVGDWKGNGDNRGGDKDAGETAASQAGLKWKGRKKGTSFLDEILAERSKKRKKR
ncbi:DUF3245 domain-containing protein [Aspergillus lucknowensis]|uniref:Uncharacterized protein n=1 Tax=Aspergillus lucknowensis TaxID=176173 RepID=A0ABR4LTW8_9EURO